MKKAFTLIEILIYVSIFAVVAGLMTGIMTTFLKVSQKESALVETTSQLDFVMQTISRLVRDSSAIIVNATSTDISNDGQIGVPYDRLILRMKDSGSNPSTDRDPIIIYATSSIIKLSEGAGVNQRISDLTSSRVLVDQLQFTKFIQYPGHDTVSIDIQLTYNSQNPNSRVSRTLRSAIARVSAATFDSPLLPGADQTYDLGYSPSTRWRNAAFSGDLLVSGNVGIGTTGPGQELDINGDILLSKLGDDPLIMSNRNLFIDIDSDNNAANLVLIFSSHGSANQIMRIQEDGNVGIATTTPGSKLVIGGDGGTDRILIGNTNPLNLGELRSDMGNSRLIESPNGLSIRAASLGAPHMFISTTGNVGIGTTGPAAKLDVRGTLAMNDNIFYPRTGGDNNHKIVWENAGYAGNRLRIHEYGEILFSTLGGDRMVIQDNGNVGIGTTNPGAKLDVNGDIQAAGDIRVPGNIWGSGSNPTWGANDGGAGFNGTCPGGTYMVGVSLLSNVLTLRCRSL